MAKRGPRLKTVEDVRRYLANLIKRLDVDEIDGSKAGRLGFLASILVKTIEATQLEARIAALEERQPGKEDK